MLDLQLFGSSIATGSLVALSAIGDSKTQIQNRSAPRLCMGGIGGGADRQYGKVIAPGLPVQGLVIPANLLGMTEFPDADLTPLEMLTLYGYQDSGGAQQFFMGLLFGYDAKIGKLPGKPCGQLVSLTDGNNVWSETQVAMQNLRADKQYQIIGFYAFGATHVGLRFQSPSFRGLAPGAITNRTDVNQQGPIYFPEDDLPTFNGQDGCKLESVGNGAANACTAFVILNEVA